MQKHAESDLFFFLFQGPTHLIPTVCSHLFLVSEWTQAERQRREREKERHRVRCLPTTHSDGKRTKGVCTSHKHTQPHLSVRLHVCAFTFKMPP